VESAEDLSRAIHLRSSVGVARSHLVSSHYGTASSSTQVTSERRSEPADVADANPRKSYPIERGLKRAVDIVGATTGLIVLSPVLGLAALGIWIDDGAPAFFRQSRAGIAGRPFEVVKFRTMRRGADAERDALRDRNEISGGASFKLTDDPRITRLGRILRRSSIDELPQLWNVLRGEMSLVGPRPHPFDDVAGYAEWHHRRLSVKPGITGLWQIRGRRDPDFDKWVEYDLEYVDRWSLALDFKIMLLTVPALLRAEGR
jgi:lipopolysaccharide/colanic/teichoic acid biosynthesis glycosyltransferase